MIRILHSGGQRRPVFICDACGSEILCSSDGVVLTPECDRGGDELLRTHEAHKGACQFALVSSMGGDPDVTDLWLHLSTLLLCSMPGQSVVVSSTAREPYPGIADADAEFLRIRKSFEYETASV